MINDDGSVSPECDSFSLLPTTHPFRQAHSIAPCRDLPHRNSNYLWIVFVFCVGVLTCVHVKLRLLQNAGRWS